MAQQRGARRGRKRKKVCFFCANHIDHVEIGRASCRERV